MTRLPGGTVMPSGISVPAATIDSSPTWAPFRIVAPMPIRQQELDPAAVEGDRVADRHVVGEHGRVRVLEDVDTQLSWMLV